MPVRGSIERWITMGEKIIVYTANMGTYDKLRRPLVSGEFVAFVDSAQMACGWTQKMVDHSGMGNRRAARFYKAMSHVWLSDADVTIWLDANVHLLVYPERLINEWLGDAQIAVTKHPSRDCAYAEADACDRKRKASHTQIRRQKKAYQDAGFPRNYGMGETRCVIRRNVPDVMRFNTKWWEHIEQFTVRDQVSFPFAAWNTGVQVNYVDAWVPGHPWFEYHEHGK